MTPVNNVFMAGLGMANGAPSPASESSPGWDGEGMTRLVMNMMSRSEFMRWLKNPSERQDVNKSCGYLDPPTVQDFEQYYYREPVAARVVEVMPKETWQWQPSVYETEDSENVTAFEKAVDQLGQQLAGEKSHHAEQHGSILWEYLLRADVLSGVGRYGIILLGLDDGADLSQPVQSGARKLLYMRVFTEAQARIGRTETDTASPRFGQPLDYQVTFASPIDLTGAGDVRTVHYSRVIHIADNLDTSELFGTPRMQQVIDCLQDIRKVRGGSAEMYWRGAMPGWVFPTHPSLGGDVKMDMDKTKQAIADWFSGLDKTLVLKGLSPESLAPQVVDPTPQITVQLESICIRIACPVRVFKGSERGELASSQDDAAWNDRLKARQQNYVTPRIIVPFINRLINLGVLPVPPGGFYVYWPDISSLTDGEKATIAVARANALNIYASGAASNFMVEADFLASIMGFTTAEVKAFLDAAEKAQGGGDTQSPLLGLVGGIAAALEIFKQAAGGIISEEQAIQLLMLFFKMDEKQARKVWADGTPEPPPPPAPVVVHPGTPPGNPPANPPGNPPPAAGTPPATPPTNRPAVKA